MNDERFVVAADVFKIGDKLRLAEPWKWQAFGGEVDAVYTVQAMVVSDKSQAFGSGVGLIVEPALQPHHPHGCSVWYDSDHFKRAE